MSLCIDAWVIQCYAGSCKWRKFPVQFQEKVWKAQRVEAGSARLKETVSDSCIHTIHPIEKELAHDEVKTKILKRVMTEAKNPMCIHVFLETIIQGIYTDTHICIIVSHITL